MAYKIKDVTIDIASAAAVHGGPVFHPCGWYTCGWYSCGYPSIVPPHCPLGSVMFVPAACDALTRGCSATNRPPEDIFDPAALAMLKAELRQALNVVEQRETVLAEALQPQTLAEVDDAEKKLKEALEALSKRRAELQKDEKKG